MFNGIRARAGVAFILRDDATLGGVDLYLLCGVDWSMCVQIHLAEPKPA